MPLSRTPLPRTPLPANPKSDPVGADFYARIRAREPRTHTTPTAATFRIAGWIILALQPLCGYPQPQKMLQVAG